MNCETTFKVQQVESAIDKENFIKTWHSTWVEEGYTMITDNIVEKYSRYDQYSTDYLLMHNGSTVGTMRIIRENDTVNVPVLNDFDIQTDIEKSFCEVTLLTVKSDVRSQDHFPTLLLLRELFYFLRRNNIKAIVIAADFRLWNLLTKKLGLSCFIIIGKIQEYEGSICIPGYLNINKQVELSTQYPPRNILEKAFHE